MAFPQILIVAWVLLVALLMLNFIRNFKRAKAGKTLIVTGKVSPDPNEKMKVLKNQSSFVWPILQDHFYLDHQQMHITLASRYNDQNIAEAYTIYFRIAEDEPSIIKAANRFTKMSHAKIESLLKPLLQSALNDLVLKSPQSEESVNQALKKRGKQILNEHGCQLLSINTEDHVAP